VPINCLAKVFVLPAEETLVSEFVPSSHWLVNRATRIMSVPAKDMTYHRTERIVTMMVHIVELF
jgi:hypothetical protein